MMKAAIKRSYARLYAVVGKLDTGGLAPDEFIADRVFELTNGRTSRKSELTNIELSQLTAALSAMQTVQKTSSESKTADKYRKQVMAAIGGWLRLMNIESNADKIKSIACKAAKCTDFNKISLAGLRGIYNEFSKQQKALQNCKNITAEIVQQQTFLN